MTFELAKKLKDCGFPQGDNPEQQMLREEGQIPEVDNRTMWIKYFTPEYVEEMKEKIVYIPTLAELIEVCGEEFESLNKREHNWYANLDSIFKKHRDIKGSTPEEAIANLWLKL